MNLKNQIDKFKESTKLQIQKKNEQTSLTFNNAIRLLEGTQKDLNEFEIYIYIPIALIQVNADNTSKNLLNEIYQVIYSLYRAKEIAL